MTPRSRTCRPRRSASSFRCSRARGCIISTAPRRRKCRARSSMRSTGSARRCAPTSMAASTRSRARRSPNTRPRARTSRGSSAPSRRARSCSPTAPPRRSTSWRSPIGERLRRGRRDRALHPRASQQHAALARACASGAERNSACCRRRRTAGSISPALPISSRRGAGIIAVTHCSNVTGAVTDVAAIVAAARSVGAVVALDGAQAAPHGPLDMRALGVRFLCLLRPQDVRPDRDRRAVGPRRAAGGHAALHGRRPDDPARDAAMTPNSPTRRAGSRLARRRSARRSGSARRCDGWSCSTGPPSPRAKSPSRRACLPGSRNLRRVRIVGPGTTEDRHGVVSFTVAGRTSEEVCRRLDEHGLALRHGHHCAQPLMMTLGIEGTARASIAAYTTGKTSTSSSPRWARLRVRHREKLVAQGPLALFALTGTADYAQARGRAARDAAVAARRAAVRGWREQGQAAQRRGRRRLLRAARALWRRDAKRQRQAVPPAVSPRHAQGPRRRARHRCSPLSLLCAKGPTYAAV